MPRSPFVPVIPAGGAGTRLWPLSRGGHPKFLLDPTGEGASLLQQTLRRLTPLADAPPLIVTGQEHAGSVREQLSQPPQQGPATTGTASPVAEVVAEPSPRSSMPAIALAAALIERQLPGAVIGSFAADHLIEDQDAFSRAVANAREAAERGYLVTLGIAPTRPATAFGYIESAPTEAGAAEAVASGGEATAAQEDLAGTGARPVVRFVEKPDRERAEQFLATGRFLWNAGMFIVRVDVLLGELAGQMPPLVRGVREIAAARGTAHEQEVLERVWPTLTAIAIDHALAEPLAARGRVAVVPAAFDWDDVGDFATLARLLRERDGGTALGEDVRLVGSGSVDAVSSRATVYGATDRHIALVGLDGISIVDTEDALLVLADEQAQDLPVLVARLEERGLGRLR